MMPVGIDHPASTSVDALRRRQWRATWGALLCWNSTQAWYGLVCVFYWGLLLLGGTMAALGTPTIGAGWLGTAAFLAGATLSLRAVGLSLGLARQCAPQSRRIEFAALCAIAFFALMLPVALLAPGMLLLQALAWIWLGAMLGVAAVLVPQWLLALAYLCLISNMLLAWEIPWASLRSPLAAAAFALLNIGLWLETRRRIGNPRSGWAAALAVAACRGERNLLSSSGTGDLQAIAPTLFGPPSDPLPRAPQALLGYALGGSFQTVLRQVLRTQAPMLAFVGSLLLVAWVIGTRTYILQFLLCALPLLGAASAPSRMACCRARAAGEFAELPLLPAVHGSTSLATLFDQLLRRTALHSVWPSTLLALLGALLIGMPVALLQFVVLAAGLAVLLTYALVSSAATGRLTETGHGWAVGVILMGFLPVPMAIARLKGFAELPPAALAWLGLMATVTLLFGLDARSKLLSRPHPYLQP